MNQNTSVFNALLRNELLGPCPNDANGDNTSRASSTNSSNPLGLDRLYSPSSRSSGAKSSPSGSIFSYKTRRHSLSDDVYSGTPPLGHNEGKGVEDTPSKTMLNTMSGTGGVTIGCDMNDRPTGSSPSSSSTTVDRSYINDTSMSMDEFSNVTGLPGGLLPRRNTVRGHRGNVHSFIDESSNMFPSNNSTSVLSGINVGNRYNSRQRKISRNPFKILDAPNLQDDYYLNLLEWSKQNVLAVGLGCCVYLWSGYTSKVHSPVVVMIFCSVALCLIRFEF